MSRTTTYAYDLSGNLVTKGMPNGVAEQRAHDGRNRVSTLDNVPVGGGSSYLSAYAYGYDAAGNVMQVVETYPGGSLAGRTITNTYDGVYRLLNEQIATSGVGTVTTAYTYDKGNNRLTQVVTGGSGAGTTNYVIGNGGNGAGANQIISATLPDTTVVAFTYDANGNRTQRVAGGHTDAYSYDYENRLVGLDYETGESGTGTYGYAYDYRTRRVVRAESGTGTTQIVFDGGTSIEEFGTAGPDSPVVEYLRGNGFGGGVGGLEYSIRSGSASFNQYDSRGDVAGQTNASGAVTFQTAYEGFGEQTVTTGSTPDRQKANTKEQDPTGLLNEGYRYRDLQTGTFITRDPFGIALIQPTDKWYLDGEEVSSREYHNAVYNETFVDANLIPVRSVQMQKIDHVESNADANTKPGGISRSHIVIPGQPNIYIYVKNNPWSSLDPEGLDAILLNDSKAAHGYGHTGVLIGNDKKGWYYYAKDGSAGGNRKQFYKTYESFKQDDPVAKRYDREVRVTTSTSQDKQMQDYGNKNYDKPFRQVAKSDPQGKGNLAENCADLTAGILNAGHLKTETPKLFMPVPIEGGPGHVSAPNKQFEQFQRDHPPNQPPKKLTTTSN